MAIPGFYSQTDQDIYESGDRFIPQEQYRLGYTPSTSIANASTGITNTQAASPYIWPPQGAGGNGGTSSNKFGLNMDTLKTITSGKYVEKGGPGDMYGGNYVKTDRDIAQTEGGIWKDVNTGQNVYHANIPYKGMIGTIGDWMTGKSKNRDPRIGTWTGVEWDEEFDPTIAHRNLNFIQRYREKKAFDFAKSKAGKDAADAAATGEGTNIGGGWTQTNTGGGKATFTSDSGQKHEGYSNTQAGYERAAAENASFAQGGRTGYQGGELVTDESMMEATPAGMMEENIEEIQGEPTREQLEAIAFEIFQLPLEQLDEEQLRIVYQAAMEQEPSEEEVQFAAQEGPPEGIASLV